MRASRPAFRAASGESRRIPGQTRARGRRAVSDGRPWFPRVPDSVAGKGISSVRHFARRIDRTTMVRAVLFPQSGSPPAGNGPLVEHQKTAIAERPGTISQQHQPPARAPRQTIHATDRESMRAVRLGPRFAAPRQQDVTRETGPENRQPQRRRRQPYRDCYDHQTQCRGQPGRERVEQRDRGQQAHPEQFEQAVHERTAKE